MARWPYRTPPTVRFRLNKHSPLAKGLVGWWPVALGSRGQNNLTNYALPKHPAIPLNGTASWDGNGLRCDANDEGAEVTAATAIRLNPPLTFGCWFMPIGTPTQFGSCFGVTNNNAASDPYLAYAMDFNDPYLRVIFNAAGTFTAGAQISISAYLNQRILAIGVVKSGSQRIYINGVQQAESTATIASISYGASALVAFGDYTGITRNSNAIFYEGFIWNRELPNVEIRALSDAASRWDLYEPLMGRVVAKAPVAVGTILRQMMAQHGS